MTSNWPQFNKRSVTESRLTYLFHNDYQRSPLVLLKVASTSISHIEQASFASAFTFQRWRGGGDGGEGAATHLA